MFRKKCRALSLVVVAVAAVYIYIYIYYQAIATTAVWGFFACFLGICLTAITHLGPTENSSLLRVFLWFSGAGPPRVSVAPPTGLKGPKFLRVGSIKSHQFAVASSGVSFGLGFSSTFYRSHQPYSTVFELCIICCLLGCCLKTCLESRLLTRRLVFWPAVFYIYKYVRSLPRALHMRWQPWFPCYLVSFH